VLTRFCFNDSVMRLSGCGGSSNGRVHRAGIGYMRLKGLSLLCLLLWLLLWLINAGGLVNTGGTDVVRVTGL